MRALSLPLLLLACQAARCLPLDSQDAVDLPSSAALNIQPLRPLEEIPSNHEDSNYAPVRGFNPLDVLELLPFHGIESGEAEFLDTAGKGRKTRSVDDRRAEQANLRTAGTAGLADERRLFVVKPPCARAGPCDHDYVYEFDLLDRPKRRIPIDYFGDEEYD